MKKIIKISLISIVSIYLIYFLFPYFIKIELKEIPNSQVIYDSNNEEI
jgi:riboflavin transporter FmnP